jgi:hypothetical protein
MKHLAFSAILLAITAQASAGEPSIRSIFAKHDPNGRLPNTTIEPRGELRVEGSRFQVYYLEFINPVSLHGQQRIAIVRNGREFTGAYQCTLGSSPDDASMVIRRDKILVYLNYRPRNRQTPFVITFTRHGPSRNRYFCGNGSGWEDGI